MSHPELQPLVKNQKLKDAFIRLGLHLSAVMEYQPYNLELENKRLEQLLHFVFKYYACEDRDAMEVIGMATPPIFPRISPDSDWSRFKLWLAGKAVKQKLRDRLPHSFEILPPHRIGLLEAQQACDRLEAALNRIGIGVSLVEDLPPIIAYRYMWEQLDEEFELGTDGWVIDGCSGYCPGCLQRPWCESGQEDAWPEDQEIGKIFFIEDLRKFVSATPFSLELMKCDELKNEAGAPPFRDDSFLPDLIDLSDMSNILEGMPINLN